MSESSRPAIQTRPGNSGKFFPFTSLLTNCGVIALALIRTGLDLRAQEPSIDLQISPDIVTWR